MTDASDAARALVAHRYAKRHELVCQQCGQPFVGPDSQKYCGATCLNRARYLRMKARTP